MERSCNTGPTFLLGNHQLVLMVTASFRQRDRTPLCATVPTLTLSLHFPTQLFNTITVSCLPLKIGLCHLFFWWFLFSCGRKEDCGEEKSRGKRNCLRLALGRIFSFKELNTINPKFPLCLRSMGKCFPNFVHQRIELQLSNLKWITIKFEFIWISQYYTQSRKAYSSIVKTLPNVEMIVHI